MIRLFCAFLCGMFGATATFADDAQSTVETMTYCLNVVLAQDEAVMPVPDNGITPIIETSGDQSICKFLTDNPVTVVEAAQGLVAGYPDAVSVLNRGFNGNPDTYVASACSGEAEIFFIVNGQPGQDPDTGFAGVAAVQGSDVC